MDDIVLNTALKTHIFHIHYYFQYYILLSILI
nr:MAG TPA: hypothetical protein [Caudoviricetes sp.]DAV93019.1 MAG TPA: hypothetical protein [Bacteriophage sp.]